MMSSREHNPVQYRTKILRHLERREIVKLLDGYENCKSRISEFNVCFEECQIAQGSRIAKRNNHRSSRVVAYYTCPKM